MSKLQETKVTKMTNEGRAKHLRITGIGNKNPTLGKITLKVSIRYH